MKKGIPENLLNSQQFLIRAIVATFDETWTTKKIFDYGKKLGLNINKKACTNFLTKEKKLMNLAQRTGYSIPFEVTDNFLIKYHEEKTYYTLLFPDMYKQIEQKFKKVGYLIGRQPIKPNKPPVTVSPIDVVRAIFAAFDKPMMCLDVREIAEKYGYEVNKSAWSNYTFRKIKELKRTGKRGSYYMYKPSDEFWKVNLKRVEKFLDILPDKRQEIIEAFAKHDPGLKSQKAQNFETQPVTKANQDQAQEQESYTMVDAANVGASILQYITGLKRELRSLKEIDPNELAQLRTKLDDSNQAIINLKNEKQGLESQVSKLKSIIEQNNQKIIELTERVGTLQNRREAEARVLPGKFKMSEVARMKKMFKGD